MIGKQCLRATTSRTMIDRETLLMLLTLIGEGEDELNCDEYEDWYCVNINPVVCDHCGKPTCYVEPRDYHLIIVWEEKDDDMLLKLCARLKCLDYEPRIERYKPILGPCIPFSEMAALESSRR